MKKILLLILSSAICLSLIGCGASKDVPSSSTSKTETESSSQDVSESEENEEKITKTFEDATFEIPSDWTGSDDGKTYISPKGGIMVVQYDDLEIDFFGDEAKRELYLDTWTSNGTYEELSIQNDHEVLGVKINADGSITYLVNIKNNDKYLCFYMTGLLEDEDYGNLENDFIEIVESVKFN